MIYSFPAVRFVMSTLLSRREHSTILEGQRLGTVHNVRVPKLEKCCVSF